MQSDEEFLAAATQRGTTTFHPGCTCRMGPADSTWAVVDDQLRVHGLQGLRVVDASIMPRMISANLNASTMMIADKASDLIRGKNAPEAVRLASLAQGDGFSSMAWPVGYLQRPMTRCVHFVETSPSGLLKADIDAARAAGVKFGYWNYLDGGRDAPSIASPLASALGLQHPAVRTSCLGPISG